MADFWRVMGWDVAGNLMSYNYRTCAEAYAQIGEMIKDPAHWKLITFEEFDGFDRVYNATIWKNPIWMRDICL